MSRRRFFSLAMLLAAVGALAWFWTRFGEVAGGPFEPTREELEELAFYKQPEAWFLERLKGPRDVVDGQTLDVKLQYLSEQLWRPAASKSWMIQAIFAVPPGRRFIRGKIDREWQLYAKVTAPMRSVEDREIPGRDGTVKVRIYHPARKGDEPLPVLVYSHGGGWIFASVDALDRAVRLLANEAGVIVVSVDYRLAPEHPYPAASDDGEDAFLWAREHAAALGGDPERVAVGGDSAGGHVSINVVQRQLASGRPTPAALLLYYPGTGLPLRDRSYALFGEGYGLDARFIEFILTQTFPQMTLDDVRDDQMDPLSAESLQGFPPALVATAGFDILRDSGRAFAERLSAEGAQVEYVNFDSLTHSFLQFSGFVAEAERAATQSARDFGRIVRGARGSDGP